MARRKRMYLPGVPFHVVQRGNNRDACFFNAQDYLLYLELLRQLLRRYSVSLHAYVLMTNHVHLLLTPADESGISNLMKVVGSRYACCINKRYRRTGTLWEGRHKASPVETEAYLLKCYRYIELNPVAAGMVAEPEEYRWSSYTVNAWGAGSDIVTPHEEYCRLGKTLEERCYHYRMLFNNPLSSRDADKIRQAIHYCQPLGVDKFRQQVFRKVGQPLGYMKRGRPGKKEKLVKK